MTRRKETTKSSDSTHPPKLMVPLTKARNIVGLQIADAQRLLGLRLGTWDDLATARREHRKWHEYNIDMLKILFDSSDPSDYYLAPIFFYRKQNPDFFDLEDYYRREIREQMTRLESISERMALYGLGEELPPATAPDQSTPLSTDLFVVHGHDEAAKQAVARFIEKLDLNPIILHEKPSAGRAIIEKFEDYSNVGFAVVLLTPDDIGARKDRPKETKPRARQNVIFELGFFVGALGRERVCVLYKEGVDIPSDYHGVIYVPTDAAEGWKLKLAQEINHAGIDVDLKKVLGDRGKP